MPFPPYLLDSSSYGNKAINMTRGIVIGPPARTLNAR